MPSGPSTADWQAKMVTPKMAPQQEAAQVGVPPSAATPLGVTPSVAAPSPGGASSAADESLDDSKSLRGGSPSSWPHTPAQLSQGQRTPVPSGRPSTPGSGKARESSASIVDKLVGPVSAINPQHVMRDRRSFFERLVQFCESQGEPITQVPQVSKQTVDLHRLYIAVIKRGGFEQVTRDKTWKQICTEANSEMSESSAAGYQLRRHYQKYLLALECLETGKNASEAVAFAEKLKKKKRSDKDQQQSQHCPVPGPPGQVPTGHPGYGAHPGDPSAAYYYGHHMDPSSIPGRPQAPHGWPPQNYPGGPGVAGGPPGYPTGMRSGAPMRPSLPQQLMQSGPLMEEQQRYEEQQRQHYFQQQAAYAAQQQQQQQMPTVTASSSSLQVDASGSQSRAPSAGPPAGSATPDSNSRQSTEDTMPHRPSSRSRVPTATPPVGVPPAGSQPPPSQPPVGYYGQPQSAQMYGSPGLRPGAPPGAGMPMKPPTGYPPGYSQQQPGVYPSMHGFPEGYPPGHPGMLPQQQHALYQQQLWASQQAPRYPNAHANIPTSSSATPPMPGMLSRANATPAEISAVQQAYAAARRPPYYHMQTPGGPPSNAASPGAPPNAAARIRYVAPPSSSSSPRPPSQMSYPGQSSLPPSAARQLPVGAPMGYSQMAPSTSTGIGAMHASAAPVQSTSTAGHGAHGGACVPVLPLAVTQLPPSQLMHFPPGSVEATTISQRRRRKLLNKDLIRAEPRRLTMALRSGLETEVIWALNALNVLLYDDMAVPINLNHHPALLNIIVEHFRAGLSILYPKIFKVECESKVRTVDDESNVRTASDKGESTSIRPLVVSRSKSEPGDFTKISRTGRTVYVERKEFPEHLLRTCPPGLSLDKLDETLSPEYISERVSQGLGCGSASYLVTRLLDDAEKTRNMKLPKFSKHDIETSSNKKIDLEKDTFVNSSEEMKTEQIGTSVEMKSLRPTALCIRDEFRSKVVYRCLAISNVLRGLSFLPGNEGPMSRHVGLLFIVGRLLRLCAEEKPITRPKALIVKQDFNKDDVPPIPLVGSLSEATRRLLAPGDLLEPDDHDALMMFETANQLREDAFVIVTHLSVQLDLLDYDSEVSWPIFDGLVHWCVSKCAEARDMLLTCQASPRNCALETLCKMSVIERNVDLLISTGSFSRIEEFVKILAHLLSLNEDVPVREYAIVILNAMCAASEPVCYVTAAETPAIRHLVAFLEYGDSNMHQVVQLQGMQALRDNPELMGTSVGMLRRAASIMQHLSKVPACRRYFIKHQLRLLQFTMSQLMDSRVGATVADILFEVAKGEKELLQLEKEAQKQKEEHERSLSKASVATEELADEDVADSDIPERNNSEAEKRGRNENGIPKVVIEDADAVKPETKESDESCSPPPVKKQRLENGTLNHVHKNGGGGTQKVMVNGDASSPPMKPAVNSMPSRKSASAAAAVENGTNAAATGSVQAVA